MHTAKPISVDFPYESRFVEVNGRKIHYVEEGEGKPILFVHGNPTSSYLWRNIIPYAAPHGRAIALDLIGMGKSDKPDIPYRFRDHAPYLDGFIEALGLTDITLVIHDWGSALGFHYAHRHPLRVWPTEIPIDGTPPDVHQIVDSYSRWLKETDLPTILFHASPGGTVRKDEVAWRRATIANIETVDIGPGIHLLQEDNPHLIGEKLSGWLGGLQG